MKRTLSILLVCLICLCAVGCSAYRGGSAIAPKDEVAYEDSLGSTAIVLPEDRKLIRTVSVSAETRDFDATLTALTDALTACGGYWGNMNVQGGPATLRYATLTARVPAEQTDAFLQAVSTHGTVVSQSQQVDEVTTEYVDVQSRISALQTEQERLLELLAQASSVSELLEIEKRLSEVRYELESYTAQKNVYDNQISYATVSVSLSEVERLTDTDKSFWNEAGERLSDTVVWLGKAARAFGLFLIGSLPILGIGLVIAAAIFIPLRLRKKRRTRRTPPDEK